MRKGAALGFVVLLLAAGCGNAGSGGGGSTASDPRCQPLARMMGSADNPADAVADADDQDTGSEAGPYIATGLASFPSPAAAQTYLDTFTQAAHQCGKFRGTDPSGSTIDATVAPMALTTATADASTAVRVGLAGDGAPFQSDIVLARVGNTLVLVTNGAFTATNAEVTEEVVGKAIAKARNPQTAVSPTAEPSGAKPSSPVRAMTGFRGKHTKHHRHAHRRHPRFHL